MNESEAFRLQDLRDKEILLLIERKRDALYQRGHYAEAATFTHVHGWLSNELKQH